MVKYPLNLPQDHSVETERAKQLTGRFISVTVLMLFCLFGITLFESELSIHLLTQQYKSHEQVINHAAWHHQIQKVEHEMEGETHALTRDPRVKQRLIDQESAALGSALLPTYRRLSTEGVIDDLVVTNRDGVILFTTVRGDSPHSSLAQRVMVLGMRSFGLYQSLSGDLSHALAFPLYGERGKVIGAVIYLKRLTGSLESLAEERRAHAMLFPLGAVPYTAVGFSLGPEGSNLLRERFDASGAVEKGVQPMAFTASLGERELIVTTLPLSDFADEPVGHLLVAAEHSTGLAQIRKQRLYGYGATLLLVLTGAWSVYWLVIRVGGEMQRQLQRQLQRLNQTSNDREQALQALQQEVAQRRIAEASEQRARQLSQDVLNAAAEGMIGVDGEGRVVFINPAAEAMLGYTAEALIGQRLHETVHHHYPDGQAYPVEDCPTHIALQTGVHHDHCREVFWTRLGEALPIEYISAPFVDNLEQGGAVVNFRDIRQQIHFEQEQQRHLEAQGCLNSLLHMTHHEVELEQLFEAAFRQLLALEWFSIEAKGGLFLRDPDGGGLTLIAERNLGTAVKRECGRIDLGQCLCGRAAIERKIIYAGCVDERHTIHPEGMQPHGHYSVPIQLGEELLGVMVLYLAEGHQQRPEEEDFLTAVADIFANYLVRYRTERQLRESEAKSRAITDSAMDAIFVVNEEGVVVFWNPAAERIFGYPKMEALQAQLECLLAPEGEVELYRAGFKRLRESGELSLQGSTVEISARTLTGQTIPIELTLAMMSVGDELMVQAVARDISARLAIQQTLEFQARFEHLTAKISTQLMNLSGGETETAITQGLAEVGGFVGVDRCYIILYDAQDTAMDCRAEWTAVGVAALQAERQAVALSAFPWVIKQLHAQGMLQVNDVEAIPEMAASERAYLQMQGISSLLLVTLTHRGKTVGFIGLDVVERSYQWPSELADLLRVVGELFFNAMQWANAEQALLKKNVEQQTLITRLEEAHNQLLQSEKLASIGQLAAGVAHEINNPIGYVSSNINALGDYMNDLFELIGQYEAVEAELGETSLAAIGSLKKRLDIDYLKEDSRALMGESNEGITRVKNIVQDLKDFSRVDSGEWAMADLQQGIESTINVVWNELKYKCELVREYADLPEVECHASQLNQVFMNLLVNAAHAIEERGTITVRTGQEGEQVWVEVEDSGKGIKPEHLTKLFDPFFTTKPVGKGTGLGLSLSYGIVDKHGGHIDVSSELGKGTRFRVWVPIRQPEADSSPE